MAKEEKAAVAQKQQPQQAKKDEKGITPRLTDYSQWYLDIVKKAGLSDNSPVRGCMIIKPKPFNAAPNVFTSYWKAEDQTSGHGSFEAPFDGKHGWYWEHVNSAPVTIKVKVSGYYDAIARQ